ncbi:MAG TPA: SCO family protein [Opitutaceae bacterium]|nr:SCO family protein [Opitutaceae bacterium]
MKTTIALTLALISVAVAGAAPEAAAPRPAKRACCRACCAEEKPAAAVSAAPLSARSLYQVDATWTTDAGEPFALATLRGRPVVLAMFFANCEYACPVLVSDMARMRASLPADVRARTQFVLVSFDPVRDTPAALKAYRARVGLDAGWTLLHGDASSVQELAMLLGVKYKQDAKGQFSHSNLITVLNPQGEIAYQRAGLMGDVSELARAVERAEQSDQVAVR